MGVEKRFLFSKEYWHGNSRDGVVVNGDGYHYYRMSEEGLIMEAYEVYEKEDGEEIVNILPEMVLIDWFKDLGFQDYEILDFIGEIEFERIKGRIPAISA